MSSPLQAYTATTSLKSTDAPLSKTWKPTTNSVHFRSSLGTSSSSTGRIYTLSHTAFLLSYYVFRFNSLVEDPIRTMIEMLIPLVIAQGAWCMVCLPRSGYWDARVEGLKNNSVGSQQQTENKSGTNVGTGKGSVRRKGAAGFGPSGPQSKSDTVANMVVPLIISLILTITTLPPPLLLLTILLGAPATTHTPHTSLLALHAALLIGPPLFYTHGVSSQAWREIGSLFLPFDSPGVWGGVVGALVGGWLGAIPIPLDWDREWQKWPVTVLTGVWVGWAVGRSILGPLVMTDGRIDLRESDAKEFEERNNAAGGDLVKQKKK